METKSLKRKKIEQSVTDEIVDFVTKLPWEIALILVIVAYSALYFYGEVLKMLLPS
ncbi:hypothetical protein [Burkholderia ubonensis]|uniref:hypothetical protein n=1 Tax=Burkholderia ubonensis TaxID=101571 RepID=UPI000A4C4536|nr:hypothetical protein [Burkholderia ubonensis]